VGTRKWFPMGPCPNNKEGVLEAMEENGLDQTKKGDSRVVQNVRKRGKKGPISRPPMILRQGRRKNAGGRKGLTERGKTLPREKGGSVREEKSKAETWIAGKSFLR